jgi:Copper type II ascorbate-dependent monooxygenase, C-terminal domain
LLARGIARFGALSLATLTGCGEPAPAARLPPPVAPVDAALNPVVTVVVDAGVVVAPEAGPIISAPGWDAPIGMLDAAVQQPQAAGQITYHKQIRALLETHCADCHTKGGVGPLPFDDWSQVQPVSSAIVGAVEVGKMPPDFWDPACQLLKDDHSLSPTNRALFSAWKLSGYPEGKPADYVAPPARARLELGPPSITMSPGFTYTPGRNADEYRCFVLDELKSETYLTGLEILPGQRSEVHHVQIHRVGSDQRSALLSRDQADSKPGYACSGGTGLSSQNMFSYRPGSGPVGLLPGDAAYMEAGSTLLIQVHYNTVFLPEGQAPLPDETKIALWTLPPGQLPQRVVYRTTVFGPINLPPGDTSVISTVTKSMSELSSFGGFWGVGGTFVPGEVVGMTPHAHQLATRMWATLDRADGAKTCLDEVPNWDFNWQFDYMFKAGVPYGPDDSMTGNCEFDNGPDNQAVIDGVKQAPRQVNFGERSIDEMCQHYIWLRFERDAFLAARAQL